MQDDGGQQQQLFRTGPELRVRLDSTDPDSGRSVLALVSADTGQIGAQLEKVLCHGPGNDAFSTMQCMLPINKTNMCYCLDKDASWGELLR